MTRFGRDAAVEGAIDAAAAVVSRRHAEIHRQGSNYVLVDLGSFNGTMLKAGAWLRMRFCITTKYREAMAVLNSFVDPLIRHQAGAAPGPQKSPPQEARKLLRFKD